MKVLKYILFLLFILLGLFQSKVEAKPVVLEDDKIAVFTEQGFNEESTEKEWLSLHYLKEETFRNNFLLFHVSSETSYPNDLTEELCLKNSGNRLKSGFQSSQATSSHQRKRGEVNRFFVGNTELVDAWKALNNIGVDDAIRKNPGYLKNVDDYAKRSGKSADEVADLAKNNENGVEQFLDELEDTPASGHWDKNPFQRGRDIEDDLGQNLPETFKTIDKYDDVTGEATSIKSLDLDAKTYQSASKLRARLNKYLKDLEDFTEASQGARTVGDEFKSSKLKNFGACHP